MRKRQMPLNSLVLALPQPNRTPHSTARIPQPCFQPLALETLFKPSRHHKQHLRQHPILFPNYFNTVHKKSPDLSFFSKKLNEQPVNILLILEATYVSILYINKESYLAQGAKMKPKAFIIPRIIFHKTYTIFTHI